MASRKTDSSSTARQQSYLVSVSDLFSGLIFIFIITLMVFAMRAKQSEYDFEEKIDQQQVIVDRLTGSRGLRAQLLRDIQEAMLKEGFRIHVDTEHGILRLPEDILFPSGSAVLRPKGKQMLTVLARVLGDVLPRYTAAWQGGQDAGRAKFGGVESVFIEGHTDNAKVLNTSRFQDNWDLSTMRAINTYKELVRASSGLDSIKNEEDRAVFSVSGYSDRRPVADNTDENGRQRNRRIDLRFIMTPPKAGLELATRLQGEMEKGKTENHE